MKETNKTQEWAELGFRSRRAYEEWKNELAEDIQHGYC